MYRTSSSLRYDQWKEHPRKRDPLFRKAKSDIDDDIDDAIGIENSSVLSTRRSSLLHCTTSLAAIVATSFQNTAAVAAADSPFLEDTATSAAAAAASADGPILSDVKPGKPLESCLYTILRVREATAQESRLVSTGKFKDVQRANVKLAVKFMIQNYRLNDNLIAAAGYIQDSTMRFKASEIGQMAVDSLYTILEYFDSSDVQNLKVGTFDSMAGKEPLVLKGLESARTSIDLFLSYFPQSAVDIALQRIQMENDLNEKEFDVSLGTILNPNPKKL